MYWAVLKQVHLMVANASILDSSDCMLFPLIAFRVQAYIVPLASRHCYHSFSHAIHFSSHLSPSSGTAFCLHHPAIRFSPTLTLNPPPLRPHISTVTTRFHISFYSLHFHLLHQTPLFPQVTLTLHCIVTVQALNDSGLRVCFFPPFC